MTSVNNLEDAHDRMAAWVRDHGRAVRGYVYAMVKRNDVADGLVQEVFRRAWQARDRYAENGTARAYLLQIADRLVCDFGRRGNREVTLTEDAWRRLEENQRDGDDGPSGELLNSEARQVLQEALQELTPLQQRVLLLRYYGDMPFAQIAETLECPLGTALSHCRRALLSLRRIIQPGKP